MREIEKKLLEQIDQQRRDLVNLYNAVTTPASTRPPSLAEVRLEALALAVKARAHLDGATTDVIVETAKGFENYLKGSAVS